MIWEKPETFLWWPTKTFAISSGHWPSCQFLGTLSCPESRVPPRLIDRAWFLIAWQVWGMVSTFSHVWWCPDVRLVKVSEMLKLPKLLKEAISFEAWAWTQRSPDLNLRATSSHLEKSSVYVIRIEFLRLLGMFLSSVPGMWRAWMALRAPQIFMLKLGQGHKWLWRILIRNVRQVARKHQND